MNTIKWLFIFSPFFSSLLEARPLIETGPQWIPGAKECPQADATNRYIRVPAFHDLKSIAHVQNIPGLNMHDSLRKLYDGKEINLYYELAREFDPKKKTVIFIPGGPGQDHSFIHGLGPLMNQFVPLYESFNVVTMDHRGVGCSRPLFPGQEPPQSLLMRQAASDIEMIRKELLGPEGKITVLGFSYGTMLSQTYALLYPQNIERLYLWEGFSSSKDFSKAQRKYESFVVSNVPILKAEYAEFKAKHPEWAKKFLIWATEPWYSYTGRVVTIPKVFQDLKTSVESGDLTQAEKLVATENWAMEWMMRSISCIEIFNWRELYKDEFKIFGKNMGSCSEFEGMEEYFDYTEALKHVQAETFIYAGFFDHVTPYEAMLKIHAQIPHSYMYLDPHTGHGVDKPECFSRLTYAFINGANNEALDDITYSDACKSLPKIKTP